MRRFPLIGLVVLLLVVAAGVGALLQSRVRPNNAKAPVPAELRAPDSARVRVEVLNGTKTRGLARRATDLLRDRGFDVVESGTSRVGGDTTIVYDLTGHPDWASRVARILAPARVETHADSSRHLDVSVVLGTTWRPPANALNP